MMEPAYIYPVRIGGIVASKYRIERVLGEGGAGIVLAAKHLDLDQLVAIKLMRLTMMSPREATERCKREAMAAARIRSEHVVNIHDVGSLDDGTPYIVMEHLDGIDLSDRIEKYGRLPISEAIDYALQVCNALEAIHGAGIVHRDLKPANLYLTLRRDGSTLVKILDFGLSKFLPGSPLVMPTITRPREIAGSPGYMSPEQVRGDRDIDERTDLWAVGAILYEALTGKRAFDAGSIPQILDRVLDEEPTPVATLRRDAPQALASVVSRCLEKKKEKRYRTARDLGNALRACAASALETQEESLRERHAAGVRLVVPVPPPKSPPVNNRSRNALPRALVVAACALIALGLALHVASEPAVADVRQIESETNERSERQTDNTTIPPSVVPVAVPIETSTPPPTDPPPIVPPPQPIRTPRASHDIPDYGERK